VEVNEQTIVENNVDENAEHLDEILVETVEDSSVDANVEHLD